jgi:hypothetical protein
VYLSSKDNYLKLYQELASQRESLEYDFRPAVERAKAAKKDFVKQEQLKALMPELQCLQASSDK